MELLFAKKYVEMELCMEISVMMEIPMMVMDVVALAQKKKTGFVKTNLLNVFILQLLNYLLLKYIRIHIQILLNSMSKCHPISHYLPH